MPRFGKEKDTARKEELDRQAAAEVERLTRAGGPRSGGMGGMPGTGIPAGPPSALEMIAEEVRGAPRPSQRRPSAPTRRPAPQGPQQAFTPLPTGGVGSSLGPAGLSPGPRLARGGAPPPPPAFRSGAYDDDFGGPVTGPPVYSGGDTDEDEEMTLTEMALMDHAAHTGHRPEDLVIQYDATTAEDMRDSAMRAFYERQQARDRGPQGPATRDPFAPAGTRTRGSTRAAGPSSDDPVVAGGALAQRLANRRRREEAEAQRAAGEPAPGSGAGDGDDGALSRVLARRRQQLGTEAGARDEPAPAPGRRHAQQRLEASPGVRSMPVPPDPDDDPPSLEDPGGTAPARRRARTPAAAAAPAKKAPPARAAGRTQPAAAPKKAAKVTPAEPAGPAASTEPARAEKAVAKRAAPARAKTAAASPAKKAPAPRTAAKRAPSAPAAGAKRAPSAPAGAKRALVKAVFCIECGEKNPAVAKFCFSCGTRLAAPDG